MAKSLLIKNDDLVTLTLYYMVKQNKFGVRQYKIVEEDEAKKLLQANSKDIDTLTTKWSVPNWHSNNHLARSSTFYSPSEGATKIDWNKYQDNLFRTCLKEWDVVDDEGKPIAITPETVGALPPLIATALLNKYDSCLSLEEDDKKKS